MFTHSDHSIMKVSICFIFSSLIFSSNRIICSKLKTEDYLQLILDLYDFHRPSSVVLKYFGSTYDPLRENIVFEMMLMLSKKKILTSTISLDEQYTSQNSFNFPQKNQKMRQTAQTMSVILFTSQKAITEYENSAQSVNLDEFINFLLFIENENSSTEFCIESFQDKLKLSFDAIVLFKCVEDPAIKQLHNSRTTEISTWALWDPNSRLIMKNKGFVQAKRRKLDGKVLRIATVENSNLTQWENGKMIGYLADVLQMLEEMMNFKTKHMSEEIDFGSWNASTQTWSGVIGSIVRDEVDLVVSGLVFTHQRFLSVDFSMPLFSTKDTLFVRKQFTHESINWIGYFQPFNYKIWMSIILLILTTPLVLTLIEIKSKTSYDFSNSISECYFNVWSIYCQQGLQESPIISSLRLAYFSIFSCSYIVMALYSASLISFLTVPTSGLPFSNLEGFVKDGSYKLIVTRDGSEYDMLTESNRSIFQKMSKLMLPKNNLPTTDDECFTMVCNQRVAFYHTGIPDQRNNLNIPCRVVEIPTGQFSRAGMVLRKGSPYTKVINYHLIHLKDAGILNHLKLKYFKKRFQSKMKNCNCVGISEIAILLVILAGGNILGIIILFFERMFFNHRLENLQMRMDTVFEIS